MMCLRCCFQQYERKNMLVTLMVLIVTSFLFILLETKDCPPIPRSPSDSSYSSSSRSSTGGVTTTTPSTNKNKSNKVVINAKEQLQKLEQQQQYPWHVPGEINQLRRYMAIHDPRSYEHNFGTTQSLKFFCWINSNYLTFLN